MFDRSLPTQQHTDEASDSSSPCGRLSGVTSNIQQSMSAQGLTNIRNETRRPTRRYTAKKTAQEPQHAVRHTERKRYRGAHRRFFPYMEKEKDSMEERKHASRKISRTDESDFSDRRWSLEKENADHVIAIERLELEREKVRLKKAKLSLLQESLEDEKEKLEVKKEMLFCLQGIAKSLQNLNQEQVINFGRNFSSRNKNLGKYMERYYGD